MRNERYKRYRLKVISGSSRGKKIGVPTINFVVPKNLKLPHGIYAGWLSIRQKKYPAAIHFGPRPQFNEDEVTLEAHIIGKSLPPVFAKAELELVHFLRLIKNFSSLKALIQRIQKDIVLSKVKLEINN